MTIGLTSGLFVGLNGVRAAQTGLNVVGNNMANVNTKGYARRITHFQIAGTNSDGSLKAGAGSQVASIKAARDGIAEKALREEGASYFYQRERAMLYNSMEIDLADSDFSGIGMAMRRFFDGLEAGNLRPDNQAVRQEILASAQNLTNQVHEKFERLVDFRYRLDDEVKDTVAQVNNITRRIQEITRDINAKGNGVDDIIDERNRLINQLSELVDVEVFELEGNQIQINLRNSSTFLVSGYTVNELGTTTNADNLNEVTLTDSSGNLININNVFRDADLEGGNLAAKIQLRDGTVPDTATQNDVPTLLRKLDMLAAGLIEQFNAIHSTGYDLNGTTGTNLFTAFTPGAAPDPDRYEGAAVAFELDSALFDANGVFDPNLLALSDAGVSGTGEPGNNGIGLLMADLRHNPNVIDSTGDATLNAGTFEDFFSDITVELGLAARDAQDRFDSQEVVFKQAEMRRDQMSAVNLDEEAVMLTQYQRAFQASSRFINLMDQLTGDIIQSLG